MIHYHIHTGSKENEFQPVSLTEQPNQWLPYPAFSTTQAMQAPRKRNVEIIDLESPNQSLEKCSSAEQSYHLTEEEFHPQKKMRFQPTDDAVERSDMARVVDDLGHKQLHEKNKDGLNYLELADQFFFKRLNKSFSSECKKSLVLDRSRISIQLAK